MLLQVNMSCHLLKEKDYIFCGLIADLFHKVTTGPPRY